MSVDCEFNDMNHVHGISAIRSDTLSTYRSYFALSINVIARLLSIVPQFVLVLHCSRLRFIALLDNLKSRIQGPHQSCSHYTVIRQLVTSRSPSTGERLWRPHWQFNLSIHIKDFGKPSLSRGITEIF